MKKTFSRLLSLILALVLLSSTSGISVVFAQGTAVVDSGWNYAPAASFAAGDGSAANPYQIATAEQLAKLSNDVANGTTYGNLFFRLTTSINLSGHFWTPIGSSAHPFSGNFLGGGYSIYGMNVSAVPQAGLFGYAAGSAIENLSVSGNASGTQATGLLVGHANGVRLTNCVATGAVNGSGRAVGGLVGLAEGFSILQGGLSTASVNATGNTSAGGILGDASRATATACLSLGMVNANLSGGFVGAANSGTFTACYYSTACGAGSGAQNGTSISGITGKSIGEINSANFAAVLNLNGGYFALAPNGQMVVCGVGAGVGIPASVLTMQVLLPGEYTDDRGTSFSRLALPTTVRAVSVSDKNLTVALAVKWSSSGYSSSRGGTQRLYGTLTVPGGIVLNNAPQNRIPIDVTLYRESSSSEGNLVNDEYDFWSSVYDAVESAERGDELYVNARAYDNIPVTILEELKSKKDVTLVLERDKGNDITLKSQKLKAIPANRITYQLSELSSLIQNSTAASSSSAPSSRPQKPAASSSVAPKPPRPASSSVAPPPPPVSSSSSAEPESSSSSSSSEESISSPEESSAEETEEVSGEEVTEPEKKKSPVLPIILIAVCLAVIVGIVAFVIVRRDQ